MKYKVNVEVTETYEVTVEADSADHAEETALNMEYTEMQSLDSTAEAWVIERDGAEYHGEEQWTEDFATRALDGSPRTEDNND